MSCHRCHHLPDKFRRAHYEIDPYLLGLINFLYSFVAFGIGRGALAGGAVVGLGALCFYGLGMSSGTSAWNNSLVWPQYVRDRIRTTYAYFGGSIGLSALAAAAVFRTPALMNIVGRGGWIVSTYFIC